MEVVTKASLRLRGVRTAALVLLASTVPLACERSASADIAGPSSLSGQATLGSVITSDVVTTSTMCTTPTNCITKKSSTRIAESVGTRRAANILTSLGSLSSNPSFDRLWDGHQPPNARAQTQANNDSQNEVTNVQVTGNTLSADKSVKGRTWHIELTRDPNKGKKMSGIRLYADGELMIESKTDWEDVGGAWYHKRSETSFYHNGKVAAHQEKSYTPLSIESGKKTSSAGITSGDLTLRLVYAPDEYPPDCPYYVPICEFFQSNNPLPILNGAITGLAWIADSISNWFNALWAGAETADASYALTETVIMGMEAVSEPSMVTIMGAIAAAADAPLTGEVMEQIGIWIVEWLSDYIWLFLL